MKNKWSLLRRQQRLLIKLKVKHRQPQVPPLRLSLKHKRKRRKLKQNRKHKEMLLLLTRCLKKQRKMKEKNSSENITRASKWLPTWKKKLLEMSRKKVKILLRLMKSSIKLWQQLARKQRLQKIKPKQSRPFSAKRTWRRRFRKQHRQLKAKLVRPK